jgi:hypothetical protein
LNEKTLEKSGPDLKTGYLVSAFKDSDDMTGTKYEALTFSGAAGVVKWYLLRGYETVLVEKR